jgi:hypothetical protein
VRVVSVGPCPNCESRNITTDIIDDEFPYGIAPHSVMLKAEVVAFKCLDCTETWTGEQGEVARTEAVNAHLATRVPQLVSALRAQHEAIDRLFALLIEQTSSGCVADKVFYPSESGQPWEALLAGKAAVESVGLPL